MLPLGGLSFPTNRDELTAALTEGLADVVRVPPRRSLSLDVGQGYPALDQLRVDLSGSTVRPQYRPAPPSGPGQPGVSVTDLRIEGKPLSYGEAAVHFELA